MTTLNVMQCELETARKIFWLAVHDYVFFSTWNDQKQDWDDGAYPAINCNDLFVPGADAESLHTEELDLYIAAVKKYPEHGSAAWCAAKRNANLWREPDENSPWLKGYKEAVKGITAMLLQKRG